MGESRAVNGRGLLGLILARILNCLWCSEEENSGEVEKGEKERLPFDLVVEILAWLPVKSLIKFSDDVNRQITTCVCKCLLIVVNKKEHRNYVCNPSIHQTFQLPPLKPPLYPAYLQISCVPEHKVVATTREDRCMVVVVGAPTSSWKDLGFVPNHCGGIRFYPAINVDSVLHWVFTNNSTGDVNVVSLDSVSENFNVNIAPRGLSILAADNYPMGWDGCFALGRIVEKEMVVWILRDVKKDIWEKEIVWLTSLNFELGSENFRPFLKNRGSEWITFFKYPKEYCYYHLETNRTHPGSHEYANQIYYKPSLVSCNSGHDGPMPEWFLQILSKLEL